MTGSHIWLFLAGLGLFLFGTATMERVLRKLSGRTFKLFLSRNTTSLFKAITGGMIAAALLQSSTVVGFMTLAFVGAGIISFRNALGIILGANLGTTFSNWIVVSLGFRIDIESFSMPLVAVTSIAMFFLQNRKRLYHIFQLFFSLGILFVGLGFMKNSAVKMVGDFDFSSYAGFGSWFFVLVGIALTSIIQSSSAVVAITLTALNAGSISFPQAAAVVIGSEVGTTVKFIFSGLKGSPDKKRAAWGNFMFNVVSLLVAYIFLTPLLQFITDTIGIKDVLFALVFFQSLINILSIFIFVPFISVFVRWLVRMFPSEEENHYLSLLQADIPVADVGIEILEAESMKTMQQVVRYIRNVLHVSGGDKPYGLVGSFRHLAGVSGRRTAEYSELKKIEGELIAFSLHLREQELGREEHQQISHLVESIRYAVQAAKSVKDIRHNVKEFRESANDCLHDWYHHLQEEWSGFENAFARLAEETEQSLSEKELGELLREAFREKQTGSQLAADALKNGRLKSEEASTALNVEREIYLAKRSLLNALSLRYRRIRLQQAEWEKES